MQTELNVRAANFGAPPPGNASGLARLGAGGCALAALMVLTGCHQEPTPPPAEALPSVTVRVQPVEAKARVAAEEVVGTAQAKQRATLEAKVSGRIIRMPVVAGQAVKAGELLAQLDVGEIQAKLDQAKAVRDQAESDRNRFKNLLEQKAVTQQEYDAVESRYRVAVAAVKEAETMLGYARIEAPFDGVISRKIADVGDLASPGRPLLELADPRALQFETDISDTLINQVHQGDKLSIRFRALPQPIDGVVREIAPAADPNSRTVRVKLDLPSGPGLRLGQFGRVAVPLGTITAPRVPTSAVVVRGQMEMVFVVTNHTAQMRLVKTGKQLGREVEILSGVNPGERVVVANAAKLRDHQPVVLP